MTTKANKITTSKYTPFTFLPLNIYYQFTKYNNLFFFITLILLCIPTISPFTPFTYLIAFSLILGISMIKDALEDKKRHEQDKLMNERTTQRVRNGQQETIKVEDINTGDIIMVKDNEEVPADLILISARSHRGCRPYCFVETSNLDGENNLKRKSEGLKQDLCECPKESSGFSSPYGMYSPSVLVTKCDRNKIEAIKDFSVEETGELLNDIKCIIKTDNENFIQNDKNVLLKGSRLKNTLYVLGLTIGVGTHTKQSKNQKLKGLRISIFERMVNKRLSQLFVGYFFLLTITSILSALFVKSNNYPYLYLNPNRSTDAMKLTGTNYILFSYLIPISLFVTIEIARIFMSLFISHDPALMKQGINSNCRNSNVVEDIGIIEHILTDKTGTLTKNEMILRYIHIYKKNALIEIKKGRTLNIENNHEGGRSFLNNPFDLFMLALFTCNSCEKFQDKYEGPSQDEICILESLQPYGEILSRTEKSVTIRYKNTVITFPILMILEFSSKRQRMTIVTTLEDKIILFTKGSDQKILKNIRESQGIKKTIDENSFYRSLVIAYKEIKEKEIIDEYEQIGLANRNKKVEEIFEKIENNLKYLGSTFVEDSLEEGVKPTIEDFLKAGIKVWMITGDKKETASSCGRLCGLSNNANDGPNNNENGNQRSNNNIERPSGSGGENNNATNNINENGNNNFNGRRPGNLQNLNNRTINRQNNVEFKNSKSTVDNVHDDIPNCIVISASDIIKKLERDDFIPEKAIIYRASPEQKAKIAKLLVNSGIHTLAIGDGNNDVMMLQASHIGVGIKGNEGTQASLCADFSVPSFICLKRLLFVHGRYNFIRFSKLTVNSIYKNLLLIFIQFYYNFYNGYSGRPVFNSFFLNYFNVLFTSLIPGYIAIFDKDRDEEDLMNTPQKYKETGRYFNNRTMALNVIMPIFKAALIFWLVYWSFVLKDFTNSNGFIGGYPSLNNCLSLFVYLTVFFRQIRLISYFNVFSIVCIVTTIILYFGVIFGIQEFNDITKNSSFHLYSMPVFYFSFLSIFGLIFFIDFLYDVFHKKIL